MSVDKLLKTTDVYTLQQKINEIIDAVNNSGGGGEGGTTSSRNIGEIVSSTIPLTDAGLHLLDGALIQGGGIYSAFVDYIANLSKGTLYAWVDTTDNITIYSLSETLSVGDLIYFNYNGVLEQDFSVKTINPLSLNVDYISDGTAEGNTKLDYLTALGAWIEAAAAQGDVQYTSSANIETYGIGKACFATEAEWQTAVTTYGVCGKFVYDSTNNTVRLPKITGFIEGTTDLTALGDLVEAGLPNIEGTVENPDSSNNQPFICGGTTFDTGALYLSDKTKKGPAYGTTNYTANINFDASRSSSIYGNSTTVQPQAIKVLYYIVIANSSKTSIQVDIDEIATDLNGKADTDLSNLSNGLANTICTTAPTTTTSATAQRPAVVVENYINGTSGYRVWSDGFIEQWGTHTFGGTSWASIALLKPYSNSKYLCTVSCIGASTTRTTMKAGNSSKNTTTILYLISGGADAICSWYTAGY